MRRSMKQLIATTLLLVVAACGSDASGPGTTYEQIAGSYAGQMVGLAQGVALNAQFSLTGC